MAMDTKSKPRGTAGGAGGRGACRGAVSLRRNQEAWQGREGRRRGPMMASVWTAHNTTLPLPPSHHNRQGGRGSYRACRREMAYPHAATLAATGSRTVHRPPAPHRHVTSHSRREVDASVAPGLSSVRIRCPAGHQVNAQRCPACPHRMHTDWARVAVAQRRRMAAAGIMARGHRAHESTPLLVGVACRTPTCRGTRLYMYLHD